MGVSLASISVHLLHEARSGDIGSLGSGVTIVTHHASAGNRIWLPQRINRCLELLCLTSYYFLNALNIIVLMCMPLILLNQSSKYKKENSDQFNYIKSKKKYRLLLMKRSYKEKPHFEKGQLQHLKVTGLFFQKHFQSFQK